MALAAVAGGSIIASRLLPHVSGTPAPTPGRISVSDMLATPDFVVAHRGGSLDWPEMSRAAYDNSLAAGVDALEMSVGRTADGVWFGCHDHTLERVSGVPGFVVSERTWEEVQAHLILPPDQHPEQEPEPFLRVEDFIDAFQGVCPLWIDPKAVHRRHYPELMSIMVARVDSPPDVFVAKCDSAIVEWGELAQREGIQGWGFYFGRDLISDPDLFTRTEGAWTMLGLDWDAETALWRMFESDGRPVIAHVLSDDAQRDVAMSHGAQGFMVSGVTEILG